MNYSRVNNISVLTLLNLSATFDTVDFSLPPSWYTFLHLLGGAHLSGLPTVSLALLLSFWGNSFSVFLNSLFSTHTYLGSDFIHFWGFQYHSFDVVHQIYVSNPVSSLEVLTFLSNHLLVISTVIPPGPRQNHLSTGLCSPLTGITPILSSLFFSMEQTEWIIKQSYHVSPLLKII